ncbi:MAG: NapC/NirT family cytochrome c [Pseudomonadota bacterium]
MSGNSPCKSRFTAVIVGIILGAGAIIMMAVGMQTTDKRPFCTSCHVMQSAGITHKASVHANVTCNDCHAPSGLVDKIPFKAMAGANDAYVNALGHPGDMIRASEAMKSVINDNCKRCHASTNMNVASMEAKPYCTGCHRNVGHMRMKPISTREVGDE